MLFVGGEYNQNQYSLPFAPSGLTNMSAVHDPVADSRSMIAAPPGVAYISGVTSTIMPDGSFVYGDKLGRVMWRLNALSLTGSSVPALLLPDGTVFATGVAISGAGRTHRRLLARRDAGGPGQLRRGT